MTKIVSLANKEEYEKEGCWGISVSIDLYGCDPEMIRTPKELERFVVELCKKVEMERHGEVMIDRFGEGELEGYSFLQFIETSSIAAHFDEIENRAFLDVFSCKYYDPQVAAEFCKNFFKAERYEINILFRK